MEEQYSGPERRKHKRVRVSLSVVFRKNDELDVKIFTEGKEAVASIVDIGEGGIAILTDLNVAVSTVLWVKFTLAKTEKPSVSYYGSIEVLGKVMSSMLTKAGPYRLGIAFQQIDDTTARQIFNFVSLFDKPKES